MPRPRLAELELPEPASTPSTSTAITLEDGDAATLNGATNGQELQDTSNRMGGVTGLLREASATAREWAAALPSELRAGALPTLQMDLSGNTTLGEEAELAKVVSQAQGSGQSSGCRAPLKRLRRPSRLGLSGRTEPAAWGSRIRQWLEPWRGGRVLSCGPMIERPCAHSQLPASASDRCCV
jgi:hypothetical protein